MVTCAILDDKEHLYLSDYYFTIVLYPESKNYKTLKNAMATCLKKLQELKETNIELDNITWTVNLYFSFDWKFLCICLGFNRANSHYYCSWYNMNKDEREDLNKK